MGAAHDKVFILGGYALPAASSDSAMPSERCDTYFRYYRSPDFSRSRDFCNPRFQSRVKLLNPLLRCLLQRFMNTTHRFLGCSSVRIQFLATMDCFGNAVLLSPAAETSSNGILARTGSFKHASTSLSVCTVLSIAIRT